MKQIVNDIDVAVNHNGEGELYGVTHLLNGEKVFEVEDLLKVNKAKPTRTIHRLFNDSHV